MITLFAAYVGSWHKAAEASVSNLRQLLGEQRKCMGRTASAAFDANNPNRVLSWGEIPQRSSLLPYRDVLSFGSTGGTGH
jgi:hypothetical protein